VLRKRNGFWSRFLLAWFAGEERTEEEAKQGGA
jgi:hypothetical protein